MLNALRQRLLSSDARLATQDESSSTAIVRSSGERSEKEAFAEAAAGGDHSRELGGIARASIQLAAIGPRLAALAVDMESRVQEQERRAAAAAETMGRLTKDLETAVAELRSKSVQVGEALATVSRIADQTRILSLNASIEAARAGVHGRAFAVVVEEVQRLADRSGKTTHLIGDRMEEMKGSIVRVESVAGSKEAESGRAGACNVGAVNREMRGMAEAASSQLASTKTLREASTSLAGFAEELLLSVGSFRFDAHRRAERDLAALGTSLIEAGTEKERCEAVVENWLKEHSHFELAYLTDARGRQFVDNLGCREGVLSRDPSCVGKDWSTRPWFRTALSANGPQASDLYRSSATDDFCFTVSFALRDSDGNPTCVLGADVNFRTLLQA